jgi:uroporphyrinogen-III synthase
MAETAGRRKSRTHFVQKPKPIWVLTRARAESHELSRAMRAAGLATRVLPCIERTRRAFPAWPWPAGDNVPFVFVTSPYAAGCVPWKRLLARSVRVAALEPKSVEVLRGLGVPVEVTARGGTVALAKALTRYRRAFLLPRDLDIVYPTSTLGTDEREQQASRRLLARLGRVSAPVCYATAAPRGLAAAVRKLPARPLGLVFASPSAVKHFDAARKQAKVRPEVRAVVCLGLSTASAWNEARLAAWPKARSVTSISQLISACQEENQP